MEHLICDLPLHSGDTLVVAELSDFLVPQFEQTESSRSVQLLIGHKVKLLLQLFQTEVFWSGHLSTTGHLETPRETQRPSNTQCLS